MHGLRARSLKPRRVAVSNRPTVTPLSRAQLLHRVQTTTHPSPFARHFRFPFNGLAPPELRRMFCSCRAAVRVARMHRRMTPRPVQHGGGVESDISASRLEPTDAEAHAAAVISAISGIRREDCRTGATVSRLESSNSPSGRLQPSNRHTVKPCATSASGAGDRAPTSGGASESATGRAASPADAFL